MKTHTTIGAKILREAGRRSPSGRRDCADQHESWDGTGDPGGLRAVEIPIAGRIVAVADAYDAMTRTRPYRDGSR